MGKNLTDTFLGTLESLSLKTKPEKVVHHAKRCLLDYLGAVFVGEFLLRQKNKKLLASMNAGATGQISLLGSHLKTDLPTAIFLNGINAHYAELDDGVMSGIVHPGAPIFSSLLPWMQIKSVTGYDFLNAVIVGYEASVRLGEVIQPSHKECGYHATATCGSLGAAVALCFMLNSSLEEKKSAISSVLVRAGGSLKVLEGNSELKPINSGHAALIAHSAYISSVAGFSGPDDVLSGRFGFIEMMTKAQNLNFLEIEENLTYKIENTYFKPYAACRYCHPAIQAALVACGKEKIDINNVSSIEISTYELAVAKHDHQKITNISSAKMSIPISVAIAIVKGSASVNDYCVPVLKDKNVQLLAQKINVKDCDEFTKQFPDKCSAKIKIIMDSGREIIERIDYAKGDPNSPLSDEEVSEKFQELASFCGLSHSKVNGLLDAVWELPSGFTNLSSRLQHVF